MADCSKTEVFLKELHRMCDSIVCSECEYGKSTESCCALIMDNIDDSMLIVQKWSDEHPAPKPKTYAEVFLEKFPNALQSMCGLPTTCRKNVFGTGYYGCELQHYDCTVCWNEPYKEEGENNG